MKFLWLVNLILAIFAYLTFIWGVWGVFRKVTDKDPTGWKILKAGAALSKVTIVMSLVQTRQIRLDLAVAATALFLGSVTLFWRCARENRPAPLSLAYSPDIPTHLVQTGPYRWVRHPFYLSYLLAYLAGALAAGKAVLVLIVLGMGGLYYHAAREEERKFEMSSLRDQYRAYRGRVGMFLPGVGTPKGIKRRMSEETHCERERSFR